MPALISTIALIAGCGSSGRVEVSGVVRDRTTGRAIAGARVVATDGSATRTDASGRFTLSVARGGPSVVRASASDHVDVTGTIVEGEELDLDLASSVAVSDDDPDAIVRWLGEEWVDDALRWSRLHDSLAHEAIDRDGDGTLAVRAAVALLGGSDGAHAGMECGDCHAGDTSRAMRAPESDLDATRCTACHDERPAAIGGLRDRDGDGIASPVRTEVAASLLRARGAIDGAIARSRIERCGRVAAGLDGHVLVDAGGAPLGDCDADGAIDGTEVLVTIDVLPLPLGDLARELRLLAADRSHGAHAAARTIERARAIADGATLR